MLADSRNMSHINQIDVVTIYEGDAEQGPLEMPDLSSMNLVAQDAERALLEELLTFEKAQIEAERELAGVPCGAGAFADPAFARREEGENSSPRGSPNPAGRLRPESRSGLRACSSFPKSSRTAFVSWWSSRR